MAGDVVLKIGKIDEEKVSFNVEMTRDVFDKLLKDSELSPTNDGLGDFSKTLGGAALGALGRIIFSGEAN